MSQFGYIVACILLGVLVGPLSAQLPQTRIKSRHSGYSVQHPPVMTRPPRYRVAAWGQRTTLMPATTSTTPEPPEMDDNASTYSFTDGPWYVTPTTQGYFGYSQVVGGGQSGGSSGETPILNRPVGGLFNTQSLQLPRWQRPQTKQPFITGPQRRTTTTTTTTTPETPEAEEVAAAGLNESAGIGGYCFCTFLGGCPVDAQVRPGTCSTIYNVFSVVLRLPTLRCCYRPGVAKQLGL